MSNLNLKDLLRTTLEDVERSAELSSDDTALSELKHSVVRSVAELEVIREGEPQHAKTPRQRFLQALLGTTNKSR